MNACVQFMQRSCNSCAKGTIHSALRIPHLRSIALAKHRTCEALHNMALSVNYGNDTCRSHFKFFELSSVERIFK